MISRLRFAPGGVLQAALAVALLLSSAAAHAGPVDRWAGEIGTASARFGIPQAWIRRVMRVESGGLTMLHGQPIVSRAGAIGLMQLMPGTWRDMRSALGLGTDPNAAADNILAGSFYLRLMYDRFGYPGLFAAYNAGPARYAAFLAGARALPAESRAYVAAVVSAKLPRRTGSVPPVGLFALNMSAAEAPAARPAGFADVSPGRLFVALSGPPRR